MPGELTITAWGQASFELRSPDTVVLVDPWLSTALEETGTTRHAGPAVRPEDVHEADLVCITHEHADHLDPPALAAIARQVPDAIFLAPAPTTSLVEEAGVEPG